MAHPMLLFAWRESWPLLNVGLIAIHILILFYGLYLIKAKKDTVRHPRAMILAGIVFLAFLTSFVVRILTIGPATLGSWPGPVQPTHLQTLHAGIALVTVVIVAMTYRFALTGRIGKHRRIAPWAFTLWVFTGLFGILGHFLYPRV